MTTPSTLVLRDGAKLAYCVYGKQHSKTPLVLVRARLQVNGMSSTMQDWGKLPEAIARTRPVLIFDNRGCVYC